jgi:hypothetical protein
MHFSYTSLNGYFAGSFITTVLAVLIIFPARKTTFKRKVLPAPVPQAQVIWATISLIISAAPMPPLGVCGIYVAASYKSSDISLQLITISELDVVTVVSRLLGRLSFCVALFE